MTTLSPSHSRFPTGFDLLYPLRLLVNSIQVRDRGFAHFICKLIPCACPFERYISVLGHTIHIPPLCKLNPLYEEVVSLRYRALNYLADECGEDISLYIC
jgi:hypothetical protein